MEITWEEVTTYPEMNKKIKEFLELKGDAVSLYALKRIDELEKEIKAIEKVIN